MDITVYDFLVIFIVAPFLLFKFTLIPDWIFSKAKKANKTVVIIIFAILLICIASFVVAIGSQGFSIRFVALAVAVLACVIHYLYNLKSDKDNLDTNSK
ncbi:MAG: hypothetical protein K6G15_07005 [Desulfovibrio sp.]|nr:hypothetical protein [Desulfovibrio sp.]